MTETPLPPPPTQIDLNLCRENLETLCGIVIKDKHLLQERDLFSEDKIIYDAVGRLIQPRL